jgi:putative ABC transport system ATP-binding protein
VSAPERATLEDLKAGSPAPTANAAGEAGAIVLRGVARRYETGAGVVTALEGVDLSVPAGQFVVVLGPSGCGKTTLLNVIGALDVASEGQVLVAGRDLRDRTRKELFRLRRETVCFVFQSFNLFPSLTALENVQFGADVGHRDRGRDDGAAIARQALAQVGLEPRLGHFPHELSGGEQQRVAIARALATGNPIILADEPTGELDFHTGIQILELLQGEARAGKTVVLVTHNREISRAADRVVELSGGRVVGDGPPPGGSAPVRDLRW